MGNEEYKHDKTKVTHIEIDFWGFIQEQVTFCFPKGKVQLNHGNLGMVENKPELHRKTNCHLVQSIASIGNFSQKSGANVLLYHDQI